MELENIDVLKGKITTILDNDLLSIFKDTDKSIMPNKLFNINIKEDIDYNTEYNYDFLCELFDCLDLSIDILNKKYSNISKSEYQKIKLVIAIINNKPIVYLDNPTIGLDIKSKKSLIKILKREKQKDRIILISSFDSEFLFQLSNLIIYKENNKYIICNDKYTFFADLKLLKRYDLKRPQILDFYSEVKDKTDIKLINRDNINDLIKEIYRHAQ